MYLDMKVILSAYFCNCCSFAVAVSVAIAAAVGPVIKISFTVTTEWYTLLLPSVLIIAVQTAAIIS